MKTLLTRCKRKRLLDTICRKKRLRSLKHFSFWLSIMICESFHSKPENFFLKLWLVINPNHINQWSFRFSILHNVYTLIWFRFLGTICHCHNVDLYLRRSISTPSLSLNYFKLPKYSRLYNWLLSSNRTTQYLSNGWKMDSLDSSN